MSVHAKSGGWQFSLRTMVVAVSLLAVLLAMTLSGGHIKELGSTGIYARHYGWPVPYLRVPARRAAGKLPADLFVPGLILDLALAATVAGATLGVLSFWERRRASNGKGDVR
jgi:hypothetical protein